LKDIDGSVMAVSNFTLAGFVEGRRLSFDNALPFEEAKSLFEEFCNSLDTKKKVCSVFGSYMEITMKHDGPVNVILGYKDKLLIHSILVNQLRVIVNLTNNEYNLLSSYLFYSIIMRRLCWAEFALTGRLG